jgi:signal transduction histidine kinase
MTVSKSGARNTSSAARQLERLQLPHRLLFLHSPDTPTWFRALPSHFMQTNVQTYVCTEAAAYEIAIAEFAPDAIIGHANPACLSLFTALVLVDPRHRPLCVLVEEADDDSIAAPADLVVGRSARVLRRQLDTFLWMRETLRKTEAQNEKLRRAADREKRKAATKQRQLEQDIATLSEAHSRELQSLMSNLEALQERWQSRQQYVQKLERESAESAILRTAIFSNVSHEFNTPLLQIKASIKFLSEQDPENRLINMAIQSVAKLEASVQNMSQLASSLDIELAPVVIREIIQAAARKVENSLIHQDSATRIHLEIQDRLPPVLGNNKGLVAVVQRLIDNALKFSKPKPVIVSAAQEDGLVVIAVKDQGIGIASDKIPQIFDMFYQVDGGSTRHYGGMGIGLAIVRTILDKHQTQIEVESEPGKGSTFRFRLKPVNLRNELSK